MAFWGGETKVIPSTVFSYFNSQTIFYDRKKDVVVVFVYEDKIQIGILRITYKDFKGDYGNFVECIPMNQRCVTDIKEKFITLKYSGNTTTIRLDMFDNKSLMRDLDVHHNWYNDRSIFESASIETLGVMKISIERMERSLGNIADKMELAQHFFDPERK